MSVQFGRWNLDGGPADSECLQKAQKLLASYGPDSSFSYCRDGMNILYFALHTTKESCQESQPYVLKSGDVLTWDGRLDNRAEFIGLFRDNLSRDLADVAIVAASYERWGIDCLRRLIGDWALSIWIPKERSLILARDPVGIRHLYYAVEKNRIGWCTLLDPLVLLAGESFSLDEEYIAGWLGMFPATHLTPYVGISSVPPSHFVHLKPGRKTLRKYWDFDPAKKIHYSSDAEYEAHFQNVFSEAVRRRIRSNAPVLAELSGGMDSSSIVCMADVILGRGEAQTARLDTVSYYDDSEPNWNERPYFTRVEAKRGRAGCHIAVGPQAAFNLDSEDNSFVATPASCVPGSDSLNQFAACLRSRGNRVVLSGIGGDEVTGGVPTPIPELADLLARGRLVALASQLKAWALNKRRPWFCLLLEATREFFTPVAQHMRPALWLRAEFVRRNRAAVAGYPSRLRLFGAQACFQENISTLDGLRRQMGCMVPSCSPPHEKRYPYLDRDLLEFIFAVPRDQILRPGHRRSLMRRALTGVVPEEILNRRRKAFVIRAPLETISKEFPRLLKASEDMITVSLGIVDKQRLSEVLYKTKHGQEIPIVTLMRTFSLEFWLRSSLSHLPQFGLKMARDNRQRAQIWLSAS